MQTSYSILDTIFDLCSFETKLYYLITLIFPTIIHFVFKMFGVLIDVYIRLSVNYYSKNSRVSIKQIFTNSS
jgi:hypothetical protein